jgi:hypothetical protein
VQYTVKTFAELDRWAGAFARGEFEVVILVGDPGLGKSRLFKVALGPDGRFVEGRATAFQLYRELFRHRGRPFVIDDVDQLYADRDAIRLLKCLCQTDPVRTVAWHAASPQLKAEGIPTEFTTTTRVAIVANQWKSASPDVAAVADRGVLLRFRPAPAEVHAWVGTWRRAAGVDEAVYRFIGDHLALIARPSGRHYVVASQARRNGLAWQSVLCETWGLDAELAVAVELAADQTLSPDERVRRFRERTGASRATFYRRLVSLAPAGPRDSETAAVPAREPHW